METKQTAMEWLEDEFSKFNDEIVNNREITFNEFHQRRIKLWEKAREMEKAQIINAYAHGVVNEISIYSTITGEEFYKNTYGAPQ